MLPEGRDKNVLIAEIASLIESKLPTNILRQLKAYTRNAMLLNPKTMLRNVIGNAIMMPAYAVPTGCFPKSPACAPKGRSRAEAWARPL